MKNGTARRAAVLAFIRSTYAEKGYSPTVRDIGAAVGITSPGVVHFHLAALTKSGLLRNVGRRGYLPVSE